MQKLKALDLFAGIGGFSLGLESTGGFETVGFCEKDHYCQQVLRKHWPAVPIYEDVRSLTGEGINADIITGGYPCQPFSNAGNRSGEEDSRHVWPEMLRIIKAIRPSWVLAENVAGHISLGLDSVLSGLEAALYTCWPVVIPACAIGARHRRDRIIIIAHTTRPGRQQQPRSGQRFRSEDPLRARVEAGLRRPNQFRNTRPILDTGRQLLEGRIQAQADQSTDPRQAEPGLGRTADGFSFELDADRYGIPQTTGNEKFRKQRLMALGNAVVPELIEVFGHLILEAEIEGGIYA